VDDDTIVVGTGELDVDEDMIVLDTGDAIDGDDDIASSPSAENLYTAAPPRRPRREATNRQRAVPESGVERVVRSRTTTPKSKPKPKPKQKPKDIDDEPDTERERQTEDSDTDSSEEEYTQTSDSSRPRKPPRKGPAQRYDSRAVSSSSDEPLMARRMRRQAAAVPNTSGARRSQRLHTAAKEAENRSDAIAESQVHQHEYAGDDTDAIDTLAKDDEGDVQMEDASTQSSDEETEVPRRAPSPAPARQAAQGRNAHATGMVGPRPAARATPSTGRDNVA